MKQFLNKIIRPSGRIPDILPLAAVIAFIVTLLGQLAGLGIMNIPAVNTLIDRFTGNGDISEFLILYLEFIGIWIVVLLFVLIFPKNHPMFRAVTHKARGNSPRALWLGLMLGFFSNGFCILMSWLMGDIKLSFAGFRPLLLLGFLVAVFIQSAAEELCTRMYLYQKQRRRYRSALVAIIGNALLFAALHFGNPGFTWLAAAQIFLFGFLASLLVYYYDSLWAAMTFHAGWNYTQSLLFGLPNSGLVSAYSLFRLEAASARNGFFYNVNFGVECSVGACLVLLLITVIIILKNRKRPERTDLWKDLEEEMRLKKEAVQN
ncbi:MAG: CPBP family intramembrane metalloprotease [Solobacterium sp.]|nr:CPBP family intramembrane metalloprotease [Solobacterium sp.]